MKWNMEWTMIHFLSAPSPSYNNNTTMTVTISPDEAAIFLNSKDPAEEVEVIIWKHYHPHS